MIRRHGADLLTCAILCTSLDPLWEASPRYWSSCANAGTCPVCSSANRKEHTGKEAKHRRCGTVYADWCSNSCVMKALMSQSLLGWQHLACLILNLVKVSWYLEQNLLRIASNNSLFSNEALMVQFWLLQMARRKAPRWGSSLFYWIKK